MDPLMMMYLARQGMGQPSPVGQGLASAGGGQLGMGATAPAMQMPGMLSGDRPGMGPNTNLLGGLDQFASGGGFGKAAATAAGLPTVAAGK